MKRSYYATVWVALLSVAVTACSGGGSVAKGATDKGANKTPAEVARYNGADRQAFLETCAKEEGSSVSFYTSQPPALWNAGVAAFKKKYPGMEVNVFRAPTGDLIERANQEAKAGSSLVDIINVKRLSVSGIQDLMTPMLSPEFEAYPARAISDDKKFVNSDENVYGMLYNTNLIAANEVPKTTQDLLDPKWDGKMGLTGSTYGVHWVGLLDHLYGQAFVQKMGKQHMRVQDVASSNIAALVASGEVWLTPASTLAEAGGLQAKGAPVKWVPIDPNWASGSIGLTAKAPHPCGGMLYIDFLLSKVGQQANIDVFYESARKDMPSPAVQGLDVYDVAAFDGGNYSAAYKKWAALMDRYIITKS